MLKRTLLLAAVLLVATVGVAEAKPKPPSYPPASNSIAVSGGLYPGGSISITAQTFQAGATVTFTVTGKSTFGGTGTAGSGGVATLNRTIPNNTKTGNYTAKAKGTGADGSSLTLTTQITIASGPASVLGQSISRAQPLAGDSNDFPAIPVGVAAAAGAGLLTLALRRLRGGNAPVSESVGV